MENVEVEDIACSKDKLIERIKLISYDLNNERIKNLFLYYINEIEEESYYSKDNRKILVTLLHALEIIKENINKNKTIIEKYFNSDYGSNSKTINELMEGIIISSNQEHEYNKLKYYGYLLGNILFQDNLNKDECNRLIRLSRELSYCHIKLINMYIISQTIQVPILKRDDYTKCGIKDYKLLGILQDTLEMIQRGILNGSGKLVLDMVQINPSNIKVQGLGTLLYNLMSINKMPYDELEDLLDILSDKY